MKTRFFAALLSMIAMGALFTASAFAANACCPNNACCEGQESCCQ
jgi:uncharacterized membrane protein YphA (DoxX/SURF4 family)